MKTVMKYNSHFSQRIKMRPMFGQLIQVADESTETKTLDI